MSRNLSEQHIIELVKQHFSEEFSLDDILDILKRLFDKFCLLIDYGSYCDWENPTGEVDEDGNNLYPVITSHLEEYDLGNGGKCEMQLISGLYFLSGVVSVRYTIHARFSGMTPSTYYLIPNTAGQSSKWQLYINPLVALAIVSEVFSEHAESFSDDPADLAENLITLLINTGIFVETTVLGVATYMVTMNIQGTFQYNPGHYLGYAFTNYKPVGFEADKYFDVTDDKYCTQGIVSTYGPNNTTYSTFSGPVINPGCMFVKTLDNCPESFTIYKKAANLGYV